MSRVKAAFVKIGKGLEGLVKLLSRTEKYILAFLLIVALASLGLWFKELHDTYGNDQKIQVYTEGWLKNNTEKNINLGRLTKAGLTKYSSDGLIVGDLAEKWEISSDLLTYTFTLHENINPSELIETISQNGDLYGAVQTEAKDTNQIIFKLKQPYNFFLDVTTKPIFAYGPYEIERQSELAINLVARKDYYLGQPSINKVQIKLFDNQDELKKAYESQEIDATCDLLGEEPDARVQRVMLPRFVSLFFNTTKTPLDSVDVRKKIIDGTSVADMKLRLKLLVSNLPEVDNELDKVVKQLTEQGVELDVVRKDPVEAFKEGIAGRDYDLLLFGIDYSNGQDYYPFWHSSQITAPGRNFTHLNNLDLDKKLEEARMTSDMNRRQQLIAEIKDLIKSQYVEMPLKEDMILCQSSSVVENNTIGYITVPQDRYANIFDWTIK